MPQFDYSFESLRQADRQYSAYAEMLRQETADYLAQKKQQNEGGPIIDAEYEVVSDVPKIESRASTEAEGEQEC